MLRHWSLFFSHLRILDDSQKERKEYEKEYEDKDCKKKCDEDDDECEKAFKEAEKQAKKDAEDAAEEEAEEEYEECIEECFEEPRHTFFEAYVNTMKQTNLRGSSKAEDVSENYDDDDVDTDGSNSKAEDAIVFESSNYDDYYWNFSDDWWVGN